MKKKIIALMTAGAVALSLCGCEGVRLKKSLKKEMEASVKTDFKEEQTESQDKEDTFSFEHLKNRKFYFSSGAGGWGTFLLIRADGSFSGEYVDDDMGDVKEEYPNGTRYQAEFYGTFSQPVKVNDYTYSMRIQKISYRNEPETKEIKDGVRYCYSEAYGLDQARNILIYLPGAPLSELSEEFKSWIGFGAMMDLDTDRLPFYALNNETMQYGFFSSDIIEDAKQAVASAEEQAAVLEDSVKNDPLTQTECNEKAKQIYDLWDYALNMVWKSLKETKEADEMEELTVQEREWIAQKEEESKKAGESYEGGTMQSMAVSQKAAKMTKVRVYELLELLES